MELPSVTAGIWRVPLAEAGAQHFDERLSARHIFPWSNDGREMCGRLIDAGRGLQRELAQIGDEGCHIVIVERISGHEILKAMPAR